MRRGCGGVDAEASGSIEALRRIEAMDIEWKTDSRCHYQLEIRGTV